ncbi:MAG: outer membrane protein assembly factor BamD [Acidobacteriota bacterium]|nr:outer membrane protein assembly factor BamD [Acidobacteriota bacterium]
MKRFPAIRLLVPMLILPALLLATACGKKDDPILALSAEESLEMGQQWLAKEKYYKARRHFTHAFEVAPNTSLGREALLLAADTFFQQGGEANLIQAEAKYRDFLNRYPTSDRAPYVQLQIANSLARRIDRPDRDQTAAEQALVAYQEVLRLYPTSDYGAEARESIVKVRHQLAEHEFGVGNFYLRYGLALSAVNRFLGLLEDFPDYDQKDKIYFYLGKAYFEGRALVEADKYFSKLRREFPDSEYTKDIPKIDPDELAAAIAAEAARDEEGEATGGGSDQDPDFETVEESQS